MKTFTKEELNHIQRALKFYYEEWNNIKGKVYETAELTEEEQRMVLKLRSEFLDEWLNSSK